MHKELVYNDMRYQTADVIPHDILSLLRQCGEYVARSIGGSDIRTDRPSVKLMIDGQLRYAELMVARLTYHQNELYFHGALADEQWFVSKFTTFRVHPPKCAPAIGVLTAGWDMDAMANKFAESFDSLEDQAMRKQADDAFSVLNDWTGRNM